MVAQNIKNNNTVEQHHFLKVHVHNPQTFSTISQTIFNKNVFLILLHFSMLATLTTLARLVTLTKLCV